MSVNRMLRRGMVTGCLIDHWKTNTKQDGLRRSLALVEKGALIPLFLWVVGSASVMLVIFSFLDMRLHDMVVCYTSLIICCVASAVFIREAFGLRGFNLCKDLECLKEGLFRDKKASLKGYHHDRLAEKAREHLTCLFAQFLIFEASYRKSNEQAVNARKADMLALLRVYNRFGLCGDDEKEFFVLGERRIKDLSNQGGS